LCSLASDRYVFVSFGSNSGPSIIDTSIRVYNKKSLIDWTSSPGWSASSGMLFGQPSASANYVSVTYNFNAQIALACGGQQVVIQNILI